MFWAKKRLHSSKNFKFVKKPLFSVIKNKFATEYLKVLKKYDRQRDTNYQPVGYLTAVPPHICNM